MSDRPDEQFPEWVWALDALLQRQWELDRLFPERDPEHRTPSPTQQFPSLVWRLNREFARNNCAANRDLRTGYEVQPTPEGYAFCVQPDPPAEIETAALHAVLDWLRPAPSYSHYTTAEEKRELQELRRRLARAAQDRLDALARATETYADGPEPPRHLRWGGSRHQVRPRHYAMLVRLWTHERVEVEELRASVWEAEGEDEIPDGTIRAELHRLNARLNEIGVPYNWSLDSGYVVREDTRLAP